MSTPSLSLQAAVALLQRAIFTVKQVAMALALRLSILKQRREECSSDGLVEGLLVMLCAVKERIVTTKLRCCYVYGIVLFAYVRDTRPHMTVKRFIPRGITSMLVHDRAEPCQQCHESSHKQGMPLAWICILCGESRSTNSVLITIIVVIATLCESRRKPTVPFDHAVSSCES